MARDSHRIREISLQEIIEATCKERVNRALRTITKPSGEEFRYQIGDEIKYWQEPTSKATSGWTGTGRVCDRTRLEHCVIGTRTSADRVITRMIKQVRPILAYLGFFREGPTTPLSGRLSCWFICFASSPEDCS